MKRRFYFAGWSLLLILVCGSILLLDQIFFFSVGQESNHYFICRLKNCSRTAFRPHPKHFFLIDPSRSKYLARLARSNLIEAHNDYRLDENGFRNSVSPAAASRKIRVNIFGDSFAFGLFLKENEQIGSLLNSATSNCSFKNYGVPAFDLRQMIRLSRDEKLVAGSDVDLFLFISDDFPRITRPFEVHNFGRPFDAYDLSVEMGLQPPLPVKIPLWLGNNFFLFQQLNSLADHRFWASLDWGKVLNHLMHANESGLKRKLYFHVPIPEDYERDPATGQLRLNLPDRVSEVSLGENPLAADRQMAALFFAGDGHPNAAGARWMAKKIMEKLAEVCSPKDQDGSPPILTRR